MNSYSTDEVAQNCHIEFFVKGLVIGNFLDQTMMLVLALAFFLNEPSVRKQHNAGYKHKANEVVLSAI
ncbi:hypothetical protein HPP92_021136 [Vanilla planifolia]|uniref:U1-C C2H2-type zinc finger domain-containing protein n=1 Tax=Vanilla planifolia TaxID=51239 RepID=A0A835Q1S0_VANPL|nr:hypothetical protein HPP92_021136 [Vanilla planifolia]